MYKYKLIRYMSVHVSA